MKTFLVINTSFFGDTLLTDPLCRNIKRRYPDAKVIFIVNKPFYEAAKYMDGVDEAVCYDKKGRHKGVKGFWRFYQEYRQAYLDNIEAAFVIYGNERGICLAKLLGSKKIYSDHQGLLRFFLANGKISGEGKIHTQDKHAALFSLYTGEPAKCLPMRYMPPPEAEATVDRLLAENGVENGDALIALCTTSKRRDKDMPVEECVKLIRLLHEDGKKVLVVGTGKIAVAYVDALRGRGYGNFINLTEKTTIAELAEVIKRCQAAVSVDTGTMHLVCALGVPLVAVFYLRDEAHIAAWAPKKCYPHRLLADGDFSAETMCQNLRQLLAEGN